MTDKTEEDLALDALFETARARPAKPSPDFLARLEADVTAYVRAPAATVDQAALPRPFWAGWSAALLPVSGLVAATAAGVWIGFQIPATGLASEFLLETSTDFDVSSFLPAVGLDGFADMGGDG